MSANKWVSSIPFYSLLFPSANKWVSSIPRDSGAWVGFLFLLNAD